MVWKGPNAEKIIIHFTPITSGIFPVRSFYSHLEKTALLLVTVERIWKNNQLNITINNILINTKVVLLNL